MKSLKEIIQKYISEEGESGVPTNAVGGGNIAGVGVGPQGEPGVPPAATRKRKKKNAEDQKAQSILIQMMRRKFNG